MRGGTSGRAAHHPGRLSPSIFPTAVIISHDDRGREWRTAVEVELTRKTEARVSVILRQLLKTFEQIELSLPSRRHAVRVLAIATAPPKKRPSVTTGAATS